jgi:hypothetical protein
MTKLRISLLGAFVIFASALEARSVDLHLPAQDFLGKTTVWLALDAGAGFGSTAIQIDSSKRAFVAFQADLALRICDSEITEARQYKDFQWQTVELEGSSLFSEGEKVKLSLPG